MSLRESGIGAAQAIDYPVRNANPKLSLNPGIDANVFAEFQILEEVGKEIVMLLMENCFCHITAHVIGRLAEI
jgi:hypothetical protein